MERIARTTAASLERIGPCTDAMVRRSDTVVTDQHSDFELGIVLAEFGAMPGIMVDGLAWLERLPPIAPLLENC